MFYVFCDKTGRYEEEEECLDSGLCQHEREDRHSSDDGQTQTLPSEHVHLVSEM